MITVFDVAGSLLQHARKESLSPLKLQKLAFYSFGWYGHLTGDKLFRDQFYAMEYGPVVSPLLSAHSRRQDVTKSELEDHQGRELCVQDDYAAEVVDAIWQSYGAYNPRDLIEMTHCEEPWDIAWNKTRPDWAKRSDLSSDDIVAHFRSKRTSTYIFDGRTVVVPVLALLPDRRATCVSDASLDSMETADSRIPAAHSARAADLRRKFLIDA
jgi:uncharacterized phage-associated protein